jgi:hypothetical protein
LARYHGYILFGADQKGVRAADGTFVTTAQPIHTYHGSFSSPIRLELANSTALAAEPIPAFYAVTAVGNGQIRLANGSQVSARPIGIVTVPVAPGEAVDVVFKGIVYNDQWNWDVANGKDIYCGATGELVQESVPFTNGAARVGTILGPQTILVDIVGPQGLALDGQGGAVVKAGNAIVNVGPVDGVAVIYSGISTEHVIVLKVEVNAGANDRYDIEIYDGAISDGGTLVYRAQQVQGNYLDSFAFYHQCQNTYLSVRIVNLRQDGASFSANVKIALMLG